MHLQADQLSRLSEDMRTHPIDDRLFVVTATPDWYAGIVKFLTTQQLPAEWTKEERMKVRVNSRHFAVVDNRLFRRRADTILRSCVSQVEVPDILEACHDSACGGHFSGQFTGQKYLELAIFGLPYLRTHTIMLESVMLAKDILGMILEWRFHYMFPCH